MPLPAILAGAATVLSAAIFADDLITGGRVSEAIGKKAAQAVLDARGIPLDLDGQVNQQTITAAINVAVMPDGVEFTNLFDKEQVMADVKRMALEQAAEAFGFEGGASAEALRRAIIDKVVGEVMADMQAGGGDYLDAAAGLVEVQRLLDRPEPKEWNKPRVFTARAAKNRERQATYRASHSRKWVEIS